MAQVGFARRLSPFAAWLGLCVVLGLVILAEQSLHRRFQGLQAARATYLLAIADTELKLSQSMARVGGDAALAQNLKWKLSHSVKAALDGMLEKGQLDLVALYGPGCSDVGRAGSAAVPLHCPSPDEMRNKSKSFQWLSTPETTALAMVTPLDGTEVNLLGAVGVVVLDEQWLGLQPALKGTLQEFGLRFGPAGGLALIEPIKTENGFAATLRSDNVIDRVIYNNNVQQWFFNSSLVWPCLLMTLGWGLFVLWREAALIGTANRQLAAFADWCRSLATSSATIVPATEHPGDGMKELHLGLPHARKLVSHALQVKSEAMQGLRNKRQTLETQLKTREDELQKLKTRLAELAELDSLAVQLKRTTAIFLKRMDAFHSETEDLAQLTATEMAGEGQQLLALASAWKLGIAERGSRKFIRGLAETPHLGSDEPGAVPVLTDDDSSELNAQLETYYRHSLQLSDLAVNAARMTAQLEKTAGFASRLAGLWHGLALKSHDTEPCDTLLPPMEEAQALVQLEPAFGATRFVNPQLADLERTLPAVPKPIWTSALYHVYLALAELGKGDSVQVATRIRKDGAKTMLVIQVASTAGKVLAQRSEKQAYHLEISRSMLGPFDVGLAVLPALDGPYPVVLSWAPAVVGRAVGPSASEERATP